WRAGADRTVAPHDITVYAGNCATVRGREGPKCRVGGGTCARTAQRAATDTWTVAPLLVRGNDSLVAVTVTSLPVPGAASAGTAARADRRSPRIRRSRPWCPASAVPPEFVVRAATRGRTRRSPRARD